jgi:hypothetical protein
VEYFRAWRIATEYELPPMPFRMPALRTWAAACLLAALPFGAFAAPKTVCTITVNSPDEKDIFRKHLPAGDYKFVELVERGRPDWLASACQAKVQCDALIISGHFDGGEEFYTDRHDTSEYLTVAEMERASCSDSCPGVFSQLKEVYLFGCNTLKNEPRQQASSEILRALQRSGHGSADASRIARVLSERHAESNRDRMRAIFKNVPVIYGFSSKAPLGRYAGPVLDKYFQSTPGVEVGSGRVSNKLVSLFEKVSMTVTNGLIDAEPHAGLRGEVCNFVDDRLSDPQRVAFMHDLLKRDTTEVRMFLHHLERYSASLGAKQRGLPKTAEALEAIAKDQKARERYLEFARDTDEATVRTRMMALAGKFGWLTPQQERAEFMRTISDHIASNRVGTDEVNLACTRAQDGELPGLQALAASTGQGARVAHSAVLACLGSGDAHARVVRALTSPNGDDVAMAQHYLRHRPLPVTELRSVASAILKMPSSEAQIRALDTLAQQRVSDRESLQSVTSLFKVSRSVDVQRAVAGVLIRADTRVLERADLERSLKQYRIKTDGGDVIDALLRMLQTS